MARRLSLNDFLEHGGAAERHSDLRLLRALLNRAPRADEDDADQQEAHDLMLDGVPPDLIPPPRRDRSMKGLSFSEVEAFEDMVERLENGQQKTLSPKQREWAARRVDELGVEAETPAERNKNVPRGGKVQLAPALGDRPLKPPGRR